MKRKTQENKKQNEIISKVRDVAHNKKNNQKGITLIALVVTIVVLLILAGVSISLVLGNNGIISKAQEAKVATRAGSVEDEVALWKTDKYIADNTNGIAESESNMLSRLRENKLITEDDEVDATNKVIKIRKKDGTLVKEISYGVDSNVLINISKYPDEKKTNSVMLQVTSVEGLSNIKIETQEDVDEFILKIKQMDEQRKKDLAEHLTVRTINKREGTNFTTFEEVFLYMKEKLEDFPYSSEKEFWAAEWNDISEDEKVEILLRDISDLYYNSDTGEIITFEIINPNNEYYEHYLAKENGEYTFTVKDFITDTTYTKTVIVDNISSDSEMMYYIGVSKYNENKNGWDLELLRTEDNEPTTFDKAYIIYNGKKIEISSLIENYKDNNEYADMQIDANYIDGFEIRRYLKKLGDFSDNGISTYDFVPTKTQIFAIVKDDITYYGVATIPWL